MSRYLIGAPVPSVLPTDPAALPRDLRRHGTLSAGGLSISSLTDCLPPNRLRDGTGPPSIQFEPPLFRSERAVALCRPPRFACE
jgi:hypothetical protein